MNREIFISLTMLAIGLIFLIQSIQLPIIEKSGSIGSGFFPLMVSIFFVVITAIYNLQVLLSKEKRADKKESVRQKVIYTILLLIALFSLNYLGFPLVLFLFSVISLILFMKINTLKSIIFSGVMVLFIYLIFAKGLRLQIPLGIFG